MIKQYQRKFLFRDYEHNTQCYEALRRHIRGCHQISTKYNIDIALVREDVYYPHGSLPDRWVGYSLSFFYEDPDGQLEMLFEDVIVVMHS